MSLICGLLEQERGRQWLQNILCMPVSNPDKGLSMSDHLYLLIVSTYRRELQQGSHEAKS